MNAQNDDTFNETKIEGALQEEDADLAAHAQVAAAMGSFAKRLHEAIRVNLREAVAAMPEDEFEHFDRFASIMKKAARLLGEAENAASYFRHRAKPPFVL